MSRGVFWGAVAALLAAMAAAMVSAALQESQTFDEGIHISIGYTYLKNGDYRMNHEHPPLFKVLAALPLLPLHPRLPLDDPSWGSANQLDYSDVFMYRNRVDPDQMLFCARLPMILLTLLFGLALAAWTRCYFGAPAALFALFLFAFDPNFIAHGHYVTNDVMGAAFIFLACVTWARYLETARLRDLAIAGLVLGLALVTKFSTVFLVPLLLLLCLWRWWQQGRGGPLSLKRLLLAAVVAGALSAAVIAVVYWPATVRTFHERLWQRLNTSNPFSATLRWVALRTALPAHPYLLGVNEVALHENVGHPAYLMGMQSRMGWWYYFPVVFAVKTPTAVLLLMAAALALRHGALVRAGPLRALRAGRRIPFCWVVMALPPAVFFALCMRSHIDIGLRHLLPVYPFLYVLLAATVFHPRWRRARLPLAAVAAALLLFESVRIYPDYLAFFNTPAGGPNRGPEYLVDSNIDWGQDLKKLRRYLDSIHWKQPICACYFGRADLTYYGIPFVNLPATAEVDARREVDCLAAISITPLQEVYTGTTSYSWVREHRLITKIGYSIYVYDLRKGK